MTITPQAATNLPLVERRRAAELPSPAERREIRDRLRISRRAVAQELGVSGATVQWWENGGNPRPARAIAYRRLLDQMEALAADLGLT